jgi:hypothetical protein
MAGRTKKLILVTMVGMIVGILLIVIIAVVLGGRGSAPITAATMPALHSCGRSTNQVVTETFLMTNPGPAAVEYSAIQEWGAGTTSYTNSFLTNGILDSHSAVLFHIPLSESPTRLSISCFPHHPLRDLSDELRNLFGLPVKARVAHCAVFSDNIHK